MCHITHVAHTLCVHATREVSTCLVQDAKSLFSLGSRMPLKAHCKRPTREECWTHDFCFACNALWLEQGVCEAEAWDRTLKYRNKHQYSGPLTPVLGRSGMRVAKDAQLTYEQEICKKWVWGYEFWSDYVRVNDRRDLNRIELDEESDFARQLPNWAAIPEDEEEEAFRRVKHRSGSDSDASTGTIWPRFDKKPESVVEQMGELESSPDPRLELIHPNEFEMVTLNVHPPDADGFERQVLTKPAGPMSKEEVQRSAPFKAPPPLDMRDVHRSYQAPDESVLGRSLTHPRSKVPPRPESPDIEPLQRANSKFAEKI